MTKASDNEYPSVLFDEQPSDVSTPGSGLWRLYFKSDGLYAIDDAGTVIGPLGVSASGAVGSDTIWNAKGDLAVGTGADTAQRLAVGANGRIPMADSAETTGIRWHELTQVSDIAGGDVTMVNATTDYDGPSESLAAGTWLIIAQVLVKVIVTTSQSYGWVAKLWDGSTIHGTGYGALPTAGNYNAWAVPLQTIVAFVTLGSPTTIKVSVQCTRGSSASAIARNDPTFGLTDNEATKMIALRIA